jgi:uncharacterized membrane protein
MLLLVAGLVIFLGVHLVPVFPSFRAQLVSRWGDGRYKGLFSAVSGVGFVLIVVGFAVAPRQVPLFAPSPAAIAIAPAAMAVALVLIAAGNLRGHLRRIVQHPMLIGTLVWSGVHLLANGDVASTLLFGAFFAWAAIDLVSAIARRAVKTFTPRLAHDAIAIAGGVGAAFAFAYLHRILFGVRVMPFGL